MEPFESAFFDTEDLRDAHNRRIARKLVPNGAVLQNVEKNRTDCTDMPPDFFLLSNAERKETEDYREIAQSQIESTTILLSYILRELNGESDFSPQSNGYSLEKCMDILSRHCFVQLSDLTLGNIECCLNDGGNLLAFFPEELWRSSVEEFQEEEYELFGFRTVHITDIKNGKIKYFDPIEKSKKGEREMDIGLFDWLAKGGWCLEVYK